MSSGKIFLIVLLSLIITIFIILYFCLPSQYFDYLINMNNKEIIFSDHQKFRLDSVQLKLCKDNNLKTLEYFNKFADENNILYTVIAGSLIGSYAYNNMIPWDDDIDLAIRKSDWNKFYKLWSENKQKPRTYFPYLKWKYKYINLFGKEFMLFKHKNNDAYLKLKLPHNDYCEIDIGGIDIGYIYYDEKRKNYYESLNNKKIATELSENDKESVVPYKKFGSTTIRTIIPERGEKYLDTWYGPQWRIKEKPSKKILSKIRKKDIGL